MRFNQPTRILFNLQQQQAILIKDGKWIIEYDYGLLYEMGRIEIKFKESKPGINVTYCDKFEIYFILYEGLQLYILKRKMILLNSIKFDSKYTVGLHYFSGHLLLLGLEEIDLLKFEFIIKKKDPKIEGEVKNSKSFKQNSKYTKLDHKNRKIEQDKLPDIKQQQHEIDYKKEQKKNKPSNQTNNKIQEEDKCKYLAKDNFDIAYVSKKSIYTSKKKISKEKLGKEENYKVNNSREENCKEENIKEKNSKEKNSEEWILSFYINEDFLFFWSDKDLTIMKQVMIAQIQKEWDNDNIQGFSNWFNRVKLQIDDQSEGTYNTIQTITFQLVQKYHDLTKHENLITQVLHFIEFRYFVTGFETGQLKLWKINTAVKQSELLVHSYEGHSKQIESLVRSKNEKMFWSQGQDFSIKLWDIQQFTNIYTVNIIGIYSNLQLLTRSRFLLRNDYEMYIGYLNNNLKIYRTINSKIVSYYKHDDSILLALDNTPGLSVKENCEPIILYPPPKSMEVRQIVTDGYLYFMLLETGMLFINSNQTQIQCIQSEEIMDFDSYHMVQVIVSVYLPQKIKLPCYDADFGQSRDLQCQEQLIFGMSKGSVIAVQKNNPKKIFARMSYHREKVINIAEIDNYLFTYCSEGLLKLISITEKQIKCIRSFNSNQQIAYFTTFHNKALFFTYKGPFQIFKFKNEQLYLHCDDKGNDHEQQVLSVDYQQKTKTYLTAASDGKIKLWSSRKILLIQLIMEDNLEGAWVLKQNLLIAHCGKLSLISLEDCKFNTINYNQPKQKNEQQIKFEDYYQLIKIQQQQQKQQADTKIVQQQEILNKQQYKLKNKASVSYVAGKIYYEENNKPIILYKGKDSDLDSSKHSSSQSSISIQEQIISQQQTQQQMIRPKKQKDLLHDWEGLQEYEENRINRFQPVQALPKLLLNSVDRKQPSRQRIISRRDLTLQRIILQSINQ
ncbi:unnamed protein product [Paramecium primaurelia]|uniref:WD40-repeat-containing domain n=1 Tax=Paramecium primaurelia TaxID=5886 RepID=A0A8S1JPJ4_PARPR|nr:unnamed protein product [Paramecium primaurelia]